MLSPKTLYRLKKLAPLLVLFTIAGLMYFIVETGIMGDAEFYPSSENPYNRLGSFIGSIMIGLSTTVLFGSLEMFFFNSFMEGRSFLLRIILKTTIYVVLIAILFMIVLTSVNGLVNEIGLFSKENLQGTWNLITDFAFTSMILYSSFFLAFGLFVSETLDRMGSNAVTSFFTGKYATSQVEERIFMFLDMRSSTTIAEQLGHEQYYVLLNAYYSDMTDAILNSKANIYQYVGDEIVLSWDLKTGTQNSNCIRCFFDIQKSIDSRADWYRAQFGLVPGFKAGLHYGKVTTGEIGVLKKELLYTGDVLNTAARIQGLCNKVEADILISGELLARFNPLKGFEAENKGKYELRGRDQEVDLYSLSAR